MSQLNWQEYGSSIVIDKAACPRCYGLVRGKKKHYIRNYHRELKNGKGLTMLDILEMKARNFRANLLDAFKGLR